MRPRPVGTEDVEELSLRLLSRVPPLPLLPTVEEGNAEVPIRKKRVRKLTVEEVMMRLMRPRPVGTEDVEELSLRLLSRVPPLPLLPTVEEGNAEVPIRKIRVRKLTV